MIRIAAVADLHFGVDSAGAVAPRLERLPQDADLFLIAGDLTRVGDPQEGAVLGAELRGLGIPCVAVLGNHDYHSDRQARIRETLEHAGVHLLEGEGAVFEIGDVRVGVAGAKGFGGGFAGACGTEFGEPEMKAFVSHTRQIAENLEQAIASLDADLRVVLLHYAPVKETLQGERFEIYPFLGSYLLAEAIDRQGADLVLHGHAHHGTERGVTPGGIHVRNVALPVIRHAYRVYSLEDGRVGRPAEAVTE